MKGEKLAWYRLASHLKMTVNRLQQEMTSTEFVEWQIRLCDEVNEFHREDYYWANIAYIVAQSNSSKDVKFDPFILKFKTDSSESTKTDSDVKLQNSKNFWFGITSGIPQKGK